MGEGRFYIELGDENCILIKNRFYLSIDRNKGGKKNEREEMKERMR